jgi:small nuclear ribonucleoprotein (snRNP)-like protein
MSRGPRAVRLESDRVQPCIATPYSTPIWMLAGLRGSRLRINLTEDRSVEGTFVCFDQSKNILLSEASEQRDDDSLFLGVVLVPRSTVLGASVIADGAAEQRESGRPQARPMSGRPQARPMSGQPTTQERPNIRPERERANSLQERERANSRQERLGAGWRLQSVHGIPQPPRHAQTVQPAPRA